MESYCWTIHRDPLCDVTHISVFSSEQIAVAPLKVCHQCCFAVKKSTIIYAFHGLTGPKKQFMQLESATILRRTF